jgi:hypothetical protein
MDFPGIRNLPIVPHENIAEVDCCGCLMIRVREGQRISSARCGAVVRTVAVEDVETAVLRDADRCDLARCTFGR